MKTGVRRTSPAMAPAMSIQRLTRSSTGSSAPLWIVSTGCPSTASTIACAQCRDATGAASLAIPIPNVPQVDGATVYAIATLDLSPDEAPAALPAQVLDSPGRQRLPAILRDITPQDLGGK